jgi:hypothetical protein
MKYVIPLIRPTIKKFFKKMSMIAGASLATPGSLNPDKTDAVIKKVEMDKNMPIQLVLKVVKKIQKPK